MKRSELFFTALLVPLDLLMVILAFLAAYHLRLTTGTVDEGFYWPINQYFVFVATLAPIWIPIFGLSKLYSIKRINRIWEELGNLFIGVSGGTFLVIAWPFLTRQEFFSRLVVLYLFVFAFVFVLIGRVMMRAIRQYLYRRGIAVRTVLMVGTNRTAAELIDAFINSPNLGMRLVGLVKTRPEASIDGGLHEQKILGTIEDIGKIIKDFSVDTMIITDPVLSRNQLLRLLELAEDHKISFELTPSLFEVQSTSVDYTQIAGIPVLEYRNTPLDGWGRIIKRLVDIVGATLAIIVLSPFMLATALAVKLTSRGPIIYKNERVGDQGHFFAYKFRSMKVEHSTGAEYGGEEALKYEQELIQKQNTRRGPLYKIENDPRLTPIGQFIRTTSLDELPQLFNVIKGEMSLVGPRPHQPREVEKYERRHRKLLHIKPGLTGMAQISGRSDLEFEEEYRLDIYYVEHWSFIFDLSILLKTPFAIFASRSRKAA